MKKPELSRELRPDNIPAFLQEQNRWAPWKGVFNPKRGKWDKIPLDVKNPRRRMSTAAPDTWGTFEGAVAAYNADPNIHGIGFCMTGLKGLVGIDGDGCVQDGRIMDKAMPIVVGACSYAEYSPSGTGIRVFTLGEVPQDFTNHAEGIEVYQGDHPRFLTVTGKVLPGSPRTVNPAPEGYLDGLVAKYCTKATGDSTGDTPPMEPFAHLDGEALLAGIADRLPPYVVRELREGVDPGVDRSGRIQHLTKMLRKAGLAKAECMAVLASHPGSLGPALDRRQQDADKACRWLWDHQITPAWADERAAPVEVTFEPVETPPEPPPEEGGLSDLELMALGKSATQDSVALALRKLHAGRYVYAHQFGHWLRYDGMRWLADPQSTILEEARKVCRRANKSADLRELTKSSFYQGVVTIAKHDPAFSVLGTEFDANTDWLNTPAGVVDLTTGMTRPHNPRDRLSKVTAVSPCADGGELFLDTLFDICDGDIDLMDFHQMSMGAMLSGAPEGHWLLFWYGTGRNGKNLLADLVFHVLGDYAHKMPSNTLMTRAQEQHPTSLAALAGRRFVLSSEVSDGSFWNTSTIKELTGDETITARFMRQDEFTFRRTHKHLILGNHRPQFRETDPAMTSRMKLVPFTVSFAGRENPDLPRLLRAHAGYVLHWLIEGHLMWRANGKRLPTCAAVEAASRDYFAAQSTTAMWLEECCKSVVDDGRSGRGWHKSTTLYASYADWKKARGENPISQTRWGEEMDKLGFRRVKADGFRYVGLTLSHPGGSELAEFADLRVEGG